MAIWILTSHAHIEHPHSLKRDIFVTTSWDDGHPSDFRLANLLLKYGLRGTSYIPIRNTEHAVLDASGIRALSESGLEIGAHTYNHVRIDRMSYADALREVESGKNTLEDITGTVVSTFCYPKGKISSRARRAVRDAQFIYARTTKAFHTMPPADRLLAPVTQQIYDHAPQVHVRHGVKEANWTGLKNCFPVIIRTRSLSDQIRKHIEYVEMNGGILHLWGHSWELDEHNLWSLTEEIFQLLASIRGARFLTNSELSVPIVAS